MPARSSECERCCATERPSATAAAKRRSEASRSAADFSASNDRPLVRGVVGLHASFTVSDQTIEAAAGLCRELDTVLHVHVAEDLADVEDAIERGYDGPLERLLHFGALPPGSILAHCVHCQAARFAPLPPSKGLWIVQNPRSNRRQRRGATPGPRRERPSGGRNRRLPGPHGGRAAGPESRSSRTRRSRGPCRSPERTADIGSEPIASASNWHR